MLWDYDFITQPIKEPHSLNSDLRVIEIRKLIAKEKDASVGK